MFLDSIMENYTVIKSHYYKKIQMWMFFYVLFVTFSISALLFESIEQEDQIFCIQQKGMSQNRRLYTTLCKILDLDILIWKNFIEDLNWDIKNNHPFAVVCILDEFAQLEIRNYFHMTYHSLEYQTIEKE